MVNRVVVGAHYGLRGWVAQRVTAVVIVAYTLLFLFMLLGSGPLDHAHWHAMFASPLMRVLTVLVILSLCLHAWVGVRDIYMDYVKSTGLRFTLQAGTVVLLSAYAVWSAAILWGL